MPVSKTPSASSTRPAVHSLRTLRQLGMALQGRPPQAPDWLDLIALAIHALVTPALALALKGNCEPPPDVEVFLREVLNRNLERNRRLSAELTDALSVLNDLDIVP